MAVSESYLVFETAAGFCGIAWNGVGITCLRLPDRSAESAERALLRRTPGTRPGTPPPAVAEAIAIGYAMPLIAVMIAALFLKEMVGIYRWSAVLVGLIGVTIITWPRLTLFDQGGVGTAEALGAAAVLVSATLGAVAMVLVRKLVQTEKTPTIVLYFSLSAAVFSLATLPFGWVRISGEALTSITGCARRRRRRSAASTVQRIWFGAWIRISG